MAGAIKFDDDKPRMDLLDPLALEQMALAFTYGADKYTRILVDELNTAVWATGLGDFSLYSHGKGEYTLSFRGSVLDSPSWKDVVRALDRPEFTSCGVNLQDYIVSGAGNWLNGMKVSRLVAALLRHVVLGYMNPLSSDYDEESGLHHLAHAGACWCMLTNMALLRPDMDDRIRYKKAS